jgi:hypothetical protein
MDGQLGIHTLLGAGVLATIQIGDGTVDGTTAGADQCMATRGIVGTNHTTVGVVDGTPHTTQVIIGMDITMDTGTATMMVSIMGIGMEMAEIILDQ